MRILVVDDQPIILNSLVLLLSGIGGVEVVGKYTSAKQVLAALDLDPDIDLVLSDLQMKPVDGIELTLRIRERFGKVKVCLLTVADESESIKKAILAGANGYVLKSAEQSELEAALINIVAGNRFYSQEVLTILAKSDKEPGSAIPEHLSITPREMEVLRLIAEEFSGTEIAEKLCISPTTVETHRKHLMRKFGVKTTVGLVKDAIKYHLV